MSSNETRIVIGGPDYGTTELTAAEQAQYDLLRAAVVAAEKAKADAMAVYDRIYAECMKMPRAELNDRARPYRNPRNGPVESETIVEWLAQSVAWAEASVYPTLAPLKNAKRALTGWSIARPFERATVNGVLYGSEAAADAVRAALVAEGIPRHYPGAPEAQAALRKHGAK